MLKHPVSNRGSILLGELVAIKLALKHILQYKKVRQAAIKNIHILSDSQSAVGQLVLGWEAKSHQHTLQEVKTIIKQLEQNNISVEISWTPGHANIKGNEYADKLAKEAAQEAKEKDNLPPVISLGDVKEAARIKWQEMWEKPDKGRHLFQLRSKVDFKLDHTFQSSLGEKIITQLRTGFTELNEYLQKCNIKNDANCECGEKESVNHYLLECENYENEREQMRKRLFECCGIIHLDINMLLDAKPEDDYREWRDLILSELETYVDGTKRFTTRVLSQ